MAEYRYPNYSSYYSLNSFLAFRCLVPLFPLIPTSFLSKQFYTRTVFLPRFLVMVQIDLVDNFILNQIRLFPLSSSLLITEFYLMHLLFIVFQDCLIYSSKIITPPTSDFPLYSPNTKKKKKIVWEIFHLKTFFSFSCILPVSPHYNHNSQRIFKTPLKISDYYIAKNCHKTNNDSRYHYSRIKTWPIS